MYLIAFLGLSDVGLGLCAAFALRRASRTCDQILADELGHRGAHEKYDAELAEWRNAPRE